MYYVAGLTKGLYLYAIVMFMGTDRPGPAQNYELCAHRYLRGSPLGCAKQISHGRSSWSILQGRSRDRRTAQLIPGCFSVIVAVKNVLFVM